jgi:inosine/xanthosine triphosphatase
MHQVNAVRQAFSLVYPDRDIEIVGFEVDSGVSHQPFTEVETLAGALTRARNAAKAFEKERGGALPDLAVGLEGGVKDEPQGEGCPPALFCFAW